MDGIIFGRRNGRTDYSKSWKYTVNETTALITKYIGTATDVVVPNKIEGKPVVVQNSVANYYGIFGVFSGNASINSVTFRRGVTIANGNMSNMFVNCKGLNRVSGIPNNVTDMSWTFWGCRNLSEPPVLPANLQNMYCTFRSCTNLPASPEIPESVTNMVGTFYGCENRFTTAPVIPNGVTDLGQTFRWCHNLNVASMPKLHNNITSLFYTFADTWIKKAPEIPESVTDITAAFSGCGYLTTPPNIPKNVTKMRETFSGCVRLTKAPVIPSNVTNMAGTFQYCRNLTTAPNIPMNVTDMTRTFRNCTNLKGDIYIRSSRLNNTAMQNCFLNTALAKNVYIPCVGLDATNNTWNAAFNAEYGIDGKNGVTVIDDCVLYANDFEYTTNDTATLVTKYIGSRNDVVVPSTLNGQPVVVENSVNNTTGVFIGNQNITSVTFQGGVAIANDDMSNMFRGCWKLKTVTGTPENITNMSYTFAECTNMKISPVIPEAVTNMRSTFSVCRNLTTAPSIPASVTDMSGTFAYCNRLVSAPVIPENVKFLSQTFGHCHNLITAPVIPSGAIYVGHMFRACKNLTGNIFIQSNRINNTSMQYCFFETELPKNVYIPSVGLDATNNTWNAAFNATYGINGKNGVTVLDINAYVG